VEGKHAKLHEFIAVPALDEFLGQILEVEHFFVCGHGMPLFSGGVRNPRLSGRTFIFFTG
jgi:hypothetical protein